VPKQVTDEPVPRIPAGLLNRRTTAAIDLCVMALAFAASYLLRFEFHIPPAEMRRAAFNLPLVLGVQFAALYMSGALSFVWKYVGIEEVPAFVRAAAGSGAVLLALRFTTPDSLGELRVPISVIVLSTVGAFGGLLGIRVLRRSFFEGRLSRRRARGNTRRRRSSVLLVWAGAAGVMAVREIRSRGERDLKLKGFVDDNPLKQGAVIAGLRVLGGTDALPSLVPALGIDQVIITIATAPPAQLRRILSICERVPVRAQMIPALYDLLQGKVSISQLREVRAEDLLHREQVSLEESELWEFLRGRSVMVTGAGGSIGSELARQVARFAPSRLVLADRAEPALFAVDRELRGVRPGLEIVPVVADVGDRDRMRAVFREHRPEVVLHAAAHKHVPLMEANAPEAVRNNVFATEALGEVAGEHGAESFILISTDKAVRPSSVMGATKRVAELVAQDLGRRFPTHYVAVRFGNVLGSTGSVIPLFREQIERGGPVTVTHPAMKRYFMTIAEAAVLTLQAGAMGRGGEIFMLDMGEPVLILDLAKRMIELSGRRRAGDLDIVFTGLRPGEKLFEELQYSDEAADRTRHSKIFVGRIAPMATEELGRGLAQLRELAARGSSDEVRAFLAAFLPEAQIGGDGAPLSGDEPETAAEDAATGAARPAASGRA
jgi:FlaA1/EpsC-like NDP-sugar epimerase